MEGNKKFFSIILIVLLFLNIIMYFNQKSINRNLESQNRNLNIQIENLDSQLNRLERALHESIESIKKEQKWTSSSGYKLVEYDQSTKKIKVQVNWSFKELAPNSKVYLFYGEKIDDAGNVHQWSKEKASNKEKLIYSADIYLSPEKSYSLKVQAENSTATKGEDIVDINLKKLIQDRFSLIPAMDNSQGPRIENHMYVLNNHGGVDFLGIKSAVVEVYIKNQLESTIELQKATNNKLSDEMMKHFGYGTSNELWLNDDAIWVKGEENWVKTGENQWENKSSIPKFNELRFEATIIDNMGMEYKRSFSR